MYWYLVELRVQGGAGEPESERRCMEQLLRRHTVRLQLMIRLWHQLVSYHLIKATFAQDAFLEALTLCTTCPKRYGTQAESVLLKLNSSSKVLARQVSKAASRSHLVQERS